MSANEGTRTTWSVLSFAVLVTGIAWLAPLLGGSPRSPGLGFILWGTAPLLVALVLRLVTRDWSDLGLKPAVRRNMRWYLMSLLALPLAMALTLLIGISLSITSVAAFSLLRYLQTALTALPIFLLFALFEEVGWRGYLAPKLAALGVKSSVAAALVAVVWGSWHLPYLRELTWVYTAEDLVSFVPRYYLVCYAFSLLYGEIRSITATFWPAVLMHGVINAFGHPLVADYVTFTPGTEYIGSISTGLILVALVLLLGVTLNRWRTRTASLSKPLAYQ